MARAPNDRFVRQYSLVHHYLDEQERVRSAGHQIRTVTERTSPVIGF